jgi:hypothetical protein
MKKMTDSELATILSALRYFQANLDDGKEACEDHFKDAPALTYDEIDALCESLNTDNTILGKTDCEELNTILQFAQCNSSVVGARVISKSALNAMLKKFQIAFEETQKGG